jgi:hypothetical protein
MNWGGVYKFIPRKEREMARKIPHGICVTNRGWGSAQDFAGSLLAYRTVISSYGP